MLLIDWKEENLFFIVQSLGFNIERRPRAGKYLFHARRNLMEESKRCTKCGEVKPLTEFSRNKNTKDGLHSACKKCERESRIRKHPEIKRIKNINSDPNIRICKYCGLEKSLSEFESYKSGDKIKTRLECNECVEEIKSHLTKTCITCGIEKSINEYNKNSKSRDGKDSECKLCRKKYKEKYYKENTEFVRNSVKKYREGNPLIVRVMKKKYSDENRDYISEWQKQYYIEHYEELSEYNRLRYQENKEEYKARIKKWNATPFGKFSKILSGHKRRCKHKSVKNTLTMRQWNAILHNQQNNCCAHCGKEFNDKLIPTKDHLIPLQYKWFGLTFGNTQALCKSCNSRRKKKFSLGNAIDNILVNK